MRKSVHSVWLGLLVLVATLAFVLLSGCAGLVSGTGSASGLPTASGLVISNVQVTSATTSTSQIVWTTNVPADSAVDYGTGATYGSVTPVDPTMVTNHQVTISGLVADTTYYFQVSSTDSKNNHGKSGGHTFKTSGFSLSGAIAPASSASGATITVSGPASATATADNFGNYTLNGLANGLYTVVPSRSGYTFSPASQSASINGSNVTGVNFTSTATPAAPTISTPPANQTVTAGQTATFTVVAAGTAPLSYQWQKNGASIAGATASTYTTPATTTADSGATFAVAVSNSAGTVTSAAATLTVSAAAVAPTISTPPANQTVTAGQTATFTVVATGTAPLSYQWQKNGANIAGATATTYTTPATTTADSGATFAVVVSNSAGTVTSATATLTVNPALVQPSITGLSPTSGTVGTSVTISGANFGATQGASTVKFNGIAATPTSWSATSIHAPVPTGATTGNVVVTVGGVASNGANFNVSTVVDTTPPSVPTGLSAAAVSSSQIGLAWTASTDNVGVAGYRIFRSGAQVGTSTSTSFQDGGLNASTQYSYTVAAFDAAGNVSAQSSSASATTLASTGGGLPSTLGWFQIPNSAYQSICPSTTQFPGINGSEGCAGVVNDWSGGFADTTRNRLVWWGGGHAGYYGNEIYYLDLQTLAIGRYTDPVLGVSGSTQCSATNPLDDLNWSGTPNSFHNYQGQVYVPTIDAMFFTMGDMSRGTNSCTATPLNDGLGRAWPTWLFKFGELPSTLPASNTTAWHPQDPQFGGTLSFVGGNGWARDAVPLGEYASTDWDPVSQLVYVYDQYAIYTWNPQTNVGTLLAKSGALNTSSSPAVVSSIDPVHRIFMIYGGGQAVEFDMVAKTAAAVSTTGCSATQNATAPGIDFDTTQGLFVTWAGGNTAYLFNASSSAVSTQYGSVAPLSCLPVTYANGPATQGVNGTYGRFRYFPALGVFAVVNVYNQNAYALRLTGGTGGGGTAGPVISAIAANSITTAAATITWTTDVAATSQVEYGTTTAYGSSTTFNATLLTAHSVPLTGLTTNTVYHYRVHSKNSAGTESISGDMVFSTSASGDTTPPTVSITAPTSGATLTGTTTITANASDNVGVVGVQFLLDSVNLGSEVTASPYALSWDSSSATNGSHTLTARARDAAGNTAVSTGVTVTVTNTVAGSNTFQQRCAATGVIKCVGFDTASDITPFISPDGNGVLQASLDTTVSASGAGSLKFVIPSVSGQNSSGAWSDSLNGAFGPGSVFFVQYRQRFSPEFISVNFNGNGWKQSIFHMAGSTCASVELTTQNTWQHGFPEMYTDCGARGFVVDLGNGDSLLEQGDTATTGYNCHYQNQVAPSCAFYQPNQWMTFYYEVRLGNWGQANSTIKAWVAYEGGPLQEFINMQNYTLNFNNGPSDVYNAITLLPYNTHKDVTLTNPVAYTWYDELIVSTQPIPAPTGPTPAP